MSWRNVALPPVTPPANGDSLPLAAMAEEQRRQVLSLDRHNIPGLGAPVGSIGSAGTFDGIFRTGIMVVLLA